MIIYLISVTIFNKGGVPIYTGQWRLRQRQGAPQPLDEFKAKLLLQGKLRTIHRDFDTWDVHSCVRDYTREMVEGMFSRSPFGGF